MAKYTAIPITKETFRKLIELKNKAHKETWEELVEFLINIYEAYRKESMKKVLCNELGEASASLTAWWRILYNKLKDEELVAEALSFLKQKEEEEGIFTVDKKKCETKPQNPPE